MNSALFRRARTQTLQFGEGENQHVPAQSLLLLAGGWPSLVFDNASSSFTTTSAAIALGMIGVLE